DGVIATEASLALSAFGSVWVPQIGNAHGWVVRIDGATGNVVARIAVGAAPGSLAVSGESIWVANTSGSSGTARGANTLSRIDPDIVQRTGSVAKPEGGGRPYDVNGRCLMRSGENSADETPTESWIAILGADGRIITRSPRIEYRTMVLAERLWIQLDAGVI